MNIFYLSDAPYLAAHYQCDKHVVKMIVETAQLLSTAHRVLDGDEYADRHGLYKSTHINHPCAIWTRNSYKNYRWLHIHFIALLEEYNKRYSKLHACEKFKQILFTTPTRISYKPFTPPPKCMPEEYKLDDVVASYRNYYQKAKHTFAKWNYCPPPPWWQEMEF